MFIGDMNFGPPSIMWLATITLLVSVKWNASQNTYLVRFEQILDNEKHGSRPPWTPTLWQHASSAFSNPVEKQNKTRFHISLSDMNICWGWICLILFNNGIEIYQFSINSNLNQLNHKIQQLELTLTRS